MFNQEDKERIENESDNVVDKKKKLIKHIKTVMGR